MKIERRAVMAAPALRAQDSQRTIGGYAAVFDSPADIGGWWTETIDRGAFAEAIYGDVRALVDHDSGRVLGRTTSGTLRLAEDDHGLKVEIDLPDTSDGRDVATLVERGDISGMSFGFRVTREEWDETVEPPLRTIKGVELFEVSAVAFPAYDATELALRSSREVEDKREQDRRKQNFEGAAVRLRRKAKRDLDLRERAGR